MHKQNKNISWRNIKSCQSESVNLNILGIIDFNDASLDRLLTTIRNNRWLIVSKTLYKNWSLLSSRHNCNDNDGYFKNQNILAIVIIASSQKFFLPGIDNDCHCIAMKNVPSLKSKYEHNLGDIQLSCCQFCILIASPPKCKHVHCTTIKISSK